MSEKANKISNLSKAKFTIPAESTTTISFLGYPNYYQITNGGVSDLYIGTTMMPSTDYFDAKVSGASTKLCVDPTGHHEIYIYNPSKDDVNIIAVSFEAPFDISALAMSNFGLSLADINVNADSVIKSFETSLPAGSNKIGKVSIDGKISVNEIDALKSIVNNIYENGINKVVNIENMDKSLYNVTNYLIKPEATKSDEIYFTGKLGYIHNITEENNWSLIQIKDYTTGNYYSVSDWNDKYFEIGINSEGVDVIYEGDIDEARIIHQPYSKMIDKIDDIYKAMTEKKYPSKFEEKYICNIPGDTVETSVKPGYIVSIDGMDIDYYIKSNKMVYIKVGNAEIPVTEWNENFATDYINYTDNIDILGITTGMVIIAYKMLTHNEKLIELLEKK